MTVSHPPLKLTRHKSSQRIFSLGPIALFDKSFLQSLSTDESMWFDHFFLSVVAPFFYVETLADLDKAGTGSRTSEQEVRIIASKFPEMHGIPCSFHVNLAMGELDGVRVPLNGQVPMSGGRPVRLEDGIGVIWDESPEAKAFSRWQREDFFEVERQFAREWRRSLSTLPLEIISKRLAALAIGGESSRTLADAKNVADTAIADTKKGHDLIELALAFLGASGAERERVFSRWYDAGSPPLATYAPYSAFVLTVEIFFQVSLAAGLISNARPSNRVDIGYLYYLPFCMVFVSSDRLHRRCVPLFLRDNQDFVWGIDLKTDITELNDYFAQLPEETKQEGVMSFAKTPPTNREHDSLVGRLWDKHLRPWRDGQLAPPPMAFEAMTDQMEVIKKVIDAPELSLNETDINLRDPDAVVLERRVRRRKGSWWQVPKDLKSE